MIDSAMDASGWLNGTAFRRVARPTMRTTIAAGKGPSASFSCGANPPCRTDGAVDGGLEGAQGPDDRDHAVVGSRVTTEVIDDALLRGAADYCHRRGRMIGCNILAERSAPVDPVGQLVESDHSRSRYQVAKNSR